MNRFLLDFGEENQDTANDTPLRGDYPRFRRNELLDTKLFVPRKWLLTSTPHTVINEDPEQCKERKFQYSNYVRMGTCPKQICLGDRFLPCRRGYSFEAAHYLLTQDNIEEDTSTIDVCKQVDSLNVMYGRAALRAAIIKEGFIPGLNQDRILNFSDPTVRSQKPLYPECEKKGSWKCAPRKKRLIGSAEKMLTISVCDEIYTVDWSCNDTIAVGFDIMVEIHKCKNGVMLSSYTAESPYKNYIKTIKFSNDGSKLAMHFRSSYISTLMLHDLENKFLWDTFCKCFVETVNYCTVICICWSAYDRHILTGCTCGKISAYASDTGKCLWSKLVHTAPILVLSFSPNFKYLVSSGKDKIVRIFSWPELIPCFDVEFFKIVEVNW